MFKNWWPKLDQEENGAISKLFDLRNGWNTLVLPLNDFAQSTDGETIWPDNSYFNPFDPTRVCYFRWYSQPQETNFLGTDFEFAIDQFRIVDWTEYVSMEEKNKDFWMESGTANNYAHYDWKESLDGHDYVFGGKDEYMGVGAISNIWLRDWGNTGRWAAREWSLPPNVTTDELKLVWQLWVDDPEFFNNLDTRIEICTGICGIARQHTVDRIDL